MRKKYIRPEAEPIKAMLHSNILVGSRLDHAESKKHYYGNRKSDNIWGREPKSPWDD